MNNKHAFLIIAHNQPKQLNTLINALDNERIDIFLHLDKKSSIDFSGVGQELRYSRLILAERIPVNWGGYSIIKAELQMLEMAIEYGNYIRYHFISGVDMPLKPIDEILAFYDSHSCEQFISISGICDKNEKNRFGTDRIRYYYFFQNAIGRKAITTFWGKAINKLLILMQRAIKIDRLKKWNMEVIAYGSAYWDITDDFARYIIKHKCEIRKRYQSSFVADEIFIQTEYLNWPEYKKRYEYPMNGTELYKNDLMDVRRAVDWKRGKPYTFKYEDYDCLINSNCLFARKIEEGISDELVNRLISRIKQSE